MSVLVLDPKVISYIRKGMIYAAYNSTCDALFSSTLHMHFRDKDVETETDRIIASLYLLNQRSYSARYREEDKDHDLFNFVRRKVGLPNPFQLLKYVQSLEYNIEISTINSKFDKWVTKQEITDYELLKTWEQELTNSIIGQMQEYKDAKWSEPV